MWERMRAERPAKELTSGQEFTVLCFLLPGSSPSQGSTFTLQRVGGRGLRPGVPYKGTIAEGGFMSFNCQHSLEPPKKKISVKSCQDQTGLWACLWGLVLTVN